MLALALSSALHAQQAPPPTASEWGGIGLLQTPTARMAEDGDMSFTASHNSPYSRYNVTMQPFPWLEGSFRYINVANRRYGPAIAGDQNYKDKSIDFKVRLWEESRWLPEVAFGVRDIGGSGLFSSEYLVASKRWGPLDASIGLATGYIGNRGDLGNPLGAVDERFKTRPNDIRDFTETGQFGTNYMFRGRLGIFGGVVYQTPFEWLLLKAEYDGNDYKNEPRDNNLLQKTPLNIGVVYTPIRNVEVSAAWERGDAMMFSLTLRGNPGNAPSSAKPFDAPAVPVRATQAPTVASATTAPSPDQRRAASKAPTSTDMAETDWNEIASRLLSDAGFGVDSISRHGNELIVTGYQRRFFNPAKGLGRSSRILYDRLGDEYDWYTLRTERLGMPIVDMSVNRSTFVGYATHDGNVSKGDLKRSTELSAAGRAGTESLYHADPRRLGGGFNLGYRQNLGGPDGFILYQVAANYAGSLFLTPNLWLTGTVSADVINNYDKFRYDAPSRLPRVRTDLRRYMTTSDVTLPNLQLNTSAQLGRDTFAIAYVGYLEWMYAGIGGEILYRPVDQAWAFGANMNWVQQRDYDQHFGLRDYRVATGHATLYYAFDRAQRVVGSVSAGRYLAGDYGATVNLARVFDNGMTMGAYATKTNVSARDFGEGSFDKGIYFSIPLDHVLPRSTQARASINWNPLIRDGGAMLGRKYPLYNVTGERDRTFFYENLNDIVD